jgi:hypothetical protein
MLKYVVDIFAGLSRCFKESEPMLLSEGTTSLTLNYFILTIAFVGYENFRDIGVRMLIYLLEPI